MIPLAGTFTPPYYAVIFSTVQGDTLDGYAETAARMEKLASDQPGYLGIDSARSDIGITVSYWRDIESIRAWRDHVEHREARRMGREKWYRRFVLRIARVEREYEYSVATIEEQ